MSERLIKQAELKKFFTDDKCFIGTRYTGDLKIIPYIEPRWLKEQRSKR